MKSDSEGNVGVATGIRYVDVTPLTQAAAFGAGDTLFDRTLVANATREIDQPTELVSIALIDKDDQTAAVIDLYFLDADVVFGVLNAAPSISDADALSLQGWVSMLAADFKDVTGAKLAVKTNIGLILKPVSGTRNVYVAGVCAGTPTQTVGGLKLRLGFRN